MKLHYYPETDSLYIELSAQAGRDVKLLADGINADFAENGDLVGLDIDQASRRVDLATLETIALPLSTLKAA